MKFVTNLLIAVLAIAAIPTLAAAESQPSAVYQSSGVCQNYRPAPERMGTTVLQVNQQTGSVHAISAIQRQAANTTYPIGFAVMTEGNGTVIGCYSDWVASVTTTPGGTAQARVLVPNLQSGETYLVAVILDPGQDFVQPLHSGFTRFTAP